MKIFISCRNYTSLFSTATMKTNKEAADEDSDDFMWYFSKQCAQLLVCNIMGDHGQLHRRSEECIMKWLIHQRGDIFPPVVVIVVKADRCDSPFTIQGGQVVITSLIPEVFNGSDRIAVSLFLYCYHHNEVSSSPFKELLCIWMFSMQLGFHILWVSTIQWQ